MNAALSVGDFMFNGRATGLGLADFLTGQMSQFRHGAPGLLDQRPVVPRAVRAGHVAERRSA